MKRSRFLLVAACLALASCGNQSSDNLGVLMSGITLESSDGKYIGELVGVADPESFLRYANTVMVYNPDIDGFFYLDLTSAKPIPLTFYYFPQTDCEWDQGVISQLPIGTMCRLIEPSTGRVFEPTSTITSQQEALSRASPHSYDTCEVRQEPWTIEPGNGHTLSQPTGEVLDFGQPPVVLKVKED